MSRKGNSVFQDIINAVTNVATGGLVGFKADDGGLGAGVVGKVGVGAIKDVTGATAAEDANADARARFEQEKASAEADRAAGQKKNAQEQLQASRSAEGARGGGKGGATAGGSQFSSLGGDERDFLGL
ncbi:MAG: hypothetical protein KAQ85_08085 [Thermodesulfovibrionia bacterium]|nr:hypothetical protein [Thermodesulfovibrionia bacterium]